jgi:NADH dehydrogenase [ubiquinone] 1 alpha subcomplex assembly factor 7
MNNLERHLRDMILATGPVDVPTFMGLTVAHYYGTRDPFGVNGDFTTAPEISQMFGEMIGVFLADAWMKMGSPSPVMLCEAGPGRGTLMADILRATKNVSGFHAAVQVHLLEISIVLREKQKQALDGFNVTWHADLDTLPEIPMLFVGNEFLDALPIVQMIRSGQQWLERRIGMDGDKFVFGMSPPHFPPPPVPGKPEQGDVFEFSPARYDFVGKLGVRLGKNRGVALLIDYGHDRTAIGDTLQAVRKHQFIDVLSEIGDADLTSHVDFEAVGKAAAAYVTVHGPVGQGDFLSTLGIALRATRLGKDDDAQRLVADDQMGRLFRVMALCHDPKIQLAGFPI